MSRKHETRNTKHETHPFCLAKALANDTGGPSDFYRMMGAPTVEPKELQLALPPPESFSFPYATPYGIQSDLMHHVYKAIEGKSVAIVQSPTGTGKSLSLLCSTLTWLADDLRRTTTASLEAYREELALKTKSTDPPWVAERMFERKKMELEAARQETDERLQQVRRQEEERKQTLRAQGRDRKRMRPTIFEHADRDNTDEEDRFLPHDPSANRLQTNAEGLNLSPDVLALMAQINPSAPPPAVLPTQTKIFFTSRTHSQLSQILSELRKTSFAETTRAVALGSRKTLCVNDEVRKSGETGIDERCLDLQSAGKGKGCKYLPGRDEGGMEGTKGREFTDKVLATIQDIEDLVVLGKETHICPYYGTRAAIPEADIVTLPYNLILQRSAREALSISLKDQVLLIDEAHNLIDTILSIHSQSLSLPGLIQARDQLRTYLIKFKNRLKGRNAVMLKQVLLILAGLITVCESIEQAKDSSKLMKVGELVQGMGKGLDQVNLYEIVGYFKESKIAVKVSSYTEKLIEEELAKATTTTSQTRATTRHAAISYMHQLESFLLSLSNADADGRVLLSSTSSPSSSGKQLVTLKYVLLNPMDHFSDIVADARSIVLAGGTMEPVNDFKLQLFPQVEPSRLANFSCGHVIPKENLKTIILTKSPKGKDLEFKFETQNDTNLLDELGAVLSNVCNLVPDGVVVFLPSYRFLEKLKTTWEKSGLLAKLGMKKSLFYEPQAGGSVETVLEEYSTAINLGSSATNKKSGALLLAVVGAKLSEGINFSDKLARAVVMVGLPFPNLTSCELKERMKYVTDVAIANKQPQGDKAGRELYMVSHPHFKELPDLTYLTPNITHIS
ncbi:chl1 helicase [Phaffia rhodozyma]|uniref:ATP-dependent DNA helicase CHL1 n=1 Tax=Phaffia rhodozyma TaxID=264483 RepID=A0A0F7SU20_PHARH|nr:chl1 helicase [Phaffia rhodozyma]